jgi:hypothetical protein
MEPPPGRRAPRLEGDAKCDAMEPADDCLALADFRGAAGEHQEGGLEGVLGVLVVVQDVLAHAQDQPPVPLHQGGEGGGIPVFAEPLDQLGVRQVIGGLGAHRLAEAAEDRVKLFGGHEQSFSQTLRPAILLPAGWLWVQLPKKKENFDVPRMAVPL